MRYLTSFPADIPCGYAATLQLREHRYRNPLRRPERPRLPFVAGVPLPPPTGGAAGMNISPRYAPRTTAGKAQKTLIHRRRLVERSNRDFAVWRVVILG